MSKTTKPGHFQTDRWENEGGPTVESEHKMIAPGRFVKPLPAPAGIQRFPRLWSSTFVIEPIQAGAGFGLMEDNAENKKDQKRRLQ